jgi:hypothetical protein
MPPKRTFQLIQRGAKIKEHGVQAVDQLPLSPIPGHRWRPGYRASQTRPLGSSARRLAVGGRAATASGFGFSGGEGELLIVRCGLALVAWCTLIVDMRKRQHRAWCYLYTHWNLLLLAVYAATALLGSLLAGHIENRPQHRSVSVSVGCLASRLTSLLFPLLVTTHVFLDLGYFLFLHGRLAARGGWTGGLPYLLRGMHPTAVSKHLLNAVRSVQSCATYVFVIE